MPLKKYVTVLFILCCCGFALSAQESDSVSSRQSIAYPIIRNEISVIRALHSIHRAQMTFQATAGNGNYGSLRNLADSGFIDELLGAGEKYGYRFSLTKTDMRAGNPANFQVVAVPQTYSRTGRRSFFQDESGVIRNVDNQGFPASLSDPPLQGTDQCIPFADCEAAVIQSLRTIHSAQMTFQATVGNGNYGSFRQLREAGLIDENLASGQKFGGNYVLVKRDRSNQYPAIFSLIVIPKSAEFSSKSFYIDETGVIRVSLRGLIKHADQDDLPL